jgi:hypothetical protein
LDIKGGASVIQVSWSRPVSRFRFYEGKARCLSDVDVVIRSIGTLPWGDGQASSISPSVTTGARSPSSLFRRFINLSLSGRWLSFQAADPAPGWLNAARPRKSESDLRIGRAAFFGSGFAAILEMPTMTLIISGVVCGIAVGMLVATYVLAVPWLR